MTRRDRRVDGKRRVGVVDRRRRRRHEALNSRSQRRKPRRVFNHIIIALIAVSVPRDDIDHASSLAASMRQSVMQGVASADPRSQICFS